MSKDKEYLKTSNALIRFSKEEMQTLIIALVISEKSSEILDKFDYAKSFKNLKEDIIKIKNNLIKKEEEYEENIQTRQNI